MRNFTALRFNRPSTAANTTRIVGSLVVGTAVGLAIGALFAPETGAETRRKIAEKSNDMLASMKDEFRSILRTVKRQTAASREKVAAYAEEMKTNKMESTGTATTPGQSDETGRYDAEFIG